MHDDFSLFKEELKQRVDIHDIISEYIDLKKAGSNYTGLCPFHTEKTPSFNVSRSGQFYHCFGCGKGGDVISFLMDISGMSFMETLEQLSERTGMKMPEKHAGDPSKRAASERIAAANLTTAEYFFTTLFTDAGSNGLAYLRDRGLTDETIRSFRLGFAPSDPDDLIQFARTKTVDTMALEEAGILLRGRYGPKPKNRFAGRVMFPIVDQSVRIIGFGARLLEGDGAKYLNSPESAVYHKSKVLFGIHQAKAAIKKSRTAIIVEGYMDVISLHQAGITNAIAASGTSFTADQGRIISRLAHEAILLFDGDKAGITAAARGADNLLGTDLAIKVSILPEGHDPDSFIREHGAEALRDQLAKASDLWEFKIDQLARDGMSIDDRIKHAGEIAESISRIPDEITREVYIVNMAARIKVDDTAMRKAVEGRIRRRNRRADTDSPISHISIHQDERELLASIIAFPERARRALEETGPRVFTNPVAQAVAEQILHRLVEGEEITPVTLIGSLNDPAAQQLVAAVGMLPIEVDTAGRHIEKHLRRYRQDELQDEIAHLSQEVPKLTDPEKKAATVARVKVLNIQLKTLRAYYSSKK